MLPGQLDSNTGKIRWHLWKVLVSENRVCVCSERVYSESVCYGHYCDSGCSDQALNPFIRIFLLIFFKAFLRDRPSQPFTWFQRCKRAPNGPFASADSNKEEKQPEKPSIYSNV